jgi:hypothetical protein
VQYEVRIRDFLERGAKRRHEGVRQPVDEPDGIGHEQLAVVRQPDLAHERIEGHEQGIGRLGVGARQRIEQRRLSGVRVANQRNGRHGRLLPPLAKLPAPLPHLLDGLADRVNARANPAAVGFELRFARSPGADAAAQPRQRRAGPDEARQQIFQLGQLHLQLPFPRSRPPGEDIEDELRAVDDLAVDRFLDVAELSGRELVVEDDDVGVRFGAGRRQADDLAGPEKGRGIRLRTLLQHAQDDRGARRIGKAGKLVERPLRIEPARAAGDQPDQRRPFLSRCLTFCHIETVTRRPEGRLLHVAERKMTRIAF